MLVVLWVGHLSAQGPYAPPVGQPGSDAISKDTAAFNVWAKNVQLDRGPMDISNLSLGPATHGQASDAEGKADFQAVSLGDGGSALITLESPMKDLTGPDFAVFENGFDDTFLELATVEVSTDGIVFHVFEAVSLTDTTTQVDPFGSLDATNLHNLAGKYRGGYGVPFDLSELSGKAGLDIQNVNYIRITDVVGSVQSQYGHRDANGKLINDPWPTPFASSGFDLDAVGIISNQYSGIGSHDIEGVKVYPNPATNQVVVSNQQGDRINKISLYDLTGQLIRNFNLSSVQDRVTLDISGIRTGMYVLRAYMADGGVIASPLQIME